MFLVSGVLYGLSVIVIASGPRAIIRLVIWH